ncbi:MAG: sensor histidine kinase [Flavobacteriales bacterium]|nr:sensor histidine kinase [Flavobacteriales bacterium]
MNPRLGVFLASFLVSICLTLLVWLLTAEVSRAILFGFFLGALAVSSIVFYAFTDRFLVKSLLPIYKTIFGMTSKEKGMERLDVMQNPLDMAEKNVSDWADQRIKEIRDLQEKDDYRKEFIGNLAHELKTPLFNIQGYVSSLLEGAMEDKRVREKFLEKANKNIDRMARIVEDLDTISHLEYERLVLDISPMDAVKCVRDVVDELDNKIEKRNCRILLKATDPIMVMGDEFRIGQVFTNLLNNAIIYGKMGGNIIVTFIDFRDRILIEVTDDGPGIDPEKLPRIFERFYRVDKSRSRDVGGSGLGLSIVKHIIESHGQSINAKSEVGEGSTFSFTLQKAK